VAFESIFNHLSLQAVELFVIIVRMLLNSGNFVVEVLTKVGEFT